MWDITTYLITYDKRGERWEIHTFVNNSTTPWNRLGVEHFIRYSSCYVPDEVMRGIILDELKERGLIPH